MVWTLRRKMLIGYGLTLTLVAVVALWSLHNLSVLSSASEDILTENYKSIIAAEKMINAIERQDSASLLLIMGDADTARRQFRDNESQFCQWLGQAKSNVTVRGEAEILQQIEQASGRYVLRFSELEVELTQRPRTDAALYESLLPLFQEVRDACEKLRDLNETTMLAAAERARTVGSRAMLSVAAIALAAVLAGLVTSLLLSSLLTRPVDEMLRAAGEIARGRYDVQVPSGSSDELGRLADGFNRMARQVAQFHALNVEEILRQKSKADALIRSIDDGIILLDTQLVVDKMNPAAARMLGVDVAAAAGRHLLEVLRDETVFGFVRQAAETGLAPSIPEGQAAIELGSGDDAGHYEVSVTPVRSGSDAALGVVVLLRDVTKLTDLDRMKTDFVMKASHELRTPLASIGMSIDLLRETAGEMSERDRELLQAAHDETERLKALVSDLLDLSRIEAGRIELEIDAFPVSVLLEKAVSVFRTQAAEKSVSLEVEAPADLPAVLVDPTKITWVLTNLVANALRYVPLSGHIWLSARPVGGMVELRVSDDGPGIPYEYQSRIFDKFVQVRSDPTPGGTGLGLAICREVVRAHGGTIWVESTPGEGSTFALTLPVAPRSGPEDT